MSKKILLVTSLILVTLSAYALSRHDARVAKERMTRCQFNDAVCVGNILIDAMVAAGQNGTRPPIYTQEKAVTVYQQTNCSGTILKIVIVKQGQLQEAINNCEAGTSIDYSRSYAIDGACIETSTHGPTKSLCATAVIKANAEFN
jgi:hypothetical protein